ncbi:MAG TPA: hypothetical protein QGG47_02220 [Acidobacteriota bacterium]|nr:hypothetical protein [Acidobacteriota bacterium]
MSTTPPPERLLLTRVSAPGKLILMGEHAVVYGRPALAAATSRRLRVDLYRGCEAGVEVDLPELGHCGHVSWPEIMDYASRMRHRWERYDTSPTPEAFARLQDDRADRLVLIALAEAVSALGEVPDTQDHPLGALRLQVSSAVPVGTGFGSSAAAAVAVVAAICAASGRAERWSLIGPIAREVERRQHGAPSGVDGATVFHGGVLRARRAGEDLSIEPLAAHPDTLRRLRVFDTGRSAEPTGTVVAAVRAQRDRSPNHFEESLNDAEFAVLAFQDAVTGSSETIDAILAIRDAQRYLESLGVVPTPVCEVVRAIEAVGGGAKISGSGSLAGPGAGCLMVLLPEDIESLPEPLAALPEHDLSLGVEGVRVEAVA